MESYFDPSAPGSFGGLKALMCQSKRSVKDVKEYLLDKDAYTLHKTYKLKFKRRKTFSKGINDLWQLDLVDVSNISAYNDSHKFLFTCIDVFSRFARVLAIKNKTGKTITEAFSKMIALAKPLLVQTDKGTEYLNTNFQKLLRDNDIKHYTSENDYIKCALVERFNRTLKTKMYKYFTHKNTLKYIDVIDDLVASYNNTYHSTIKMSLSEVTAQNEHKLHRWL